MEKSLARLAGAMGLQPRTVSVDSSNTLAASLGNGFTRGECALTTAKTLERIMERSGSRADFLKGLEQFDNLFVVGFSPEQGSASVLDCLADGMLGTPTPLADDDQQYDLSADSKHLCSFLSGLSFGPVNRSTDSTFTLPPQGGHATAHIQIGERPFFVECGKGNTRVFLLACNVVADLDTPLPAGSSFRECFSHVLPEMMFLRHVFGQQCWHALQPLGCFVVDDPLLRERYGFLNYRALLEAMDQSRFATNIAFIPWNYRRTQASVAHLFKKRPDRFSLSVHGCDHTEGEFSSLDHGELVRRTRTASHRMSLHRTATGVDYDPVMVFPKGLFSASALPVLKDCGFLAAVNTTAQPVDDAFSPTLNAVCEIPAAERDGFPLFLRRYPVEIADFALDLYLGKPILIVAHHDLFRSGPAEIARFVEALNTLAPNISWCGLAAVIERACLQRHGNGGKVHVKFYARSLRLANPGADSVRYILEKSDGGATNVAGVSRDGTPIPYRFENGNLAFEVELAPRSETRIQVAYENSLVAGEGRFSMTERVNAFVRRRLSEFRDNYVAKSELLLRALNRIKPFLGAS